MIVVGFMAVAVGQQEARTGQRVLPRLGSAHTAPRRDGRVLVAVGVGVAFVGLSRLLDLPPWIDLIVALAAVAGVVWSLITYKPCEHPDTRRVDPPSDPDGVWGRNPPGY